MNPYNVCKWDHISQFYSAMWPESWPAHHTALFHRIGAGFTGNVKGKSKVTYCDGSSSVVRQHCTKLIMHFCRCKYRATPQQLCGLSAKPYVFLRELLLLAGDVELNPGPIQGRQRAASCVSTIHYFCECLLIAVCFKCQNCNISSWQMFYMKLLKYWLVNINVSLMWGVQGHGHLRPLCGCGSHGWPWPNWVLSIIQGTLLCDHYFSLSI